jgi:hypothetical protein
VTVLLELTMTVTLANVPEGGKHVTKLLIIVSGQYVL